LLANSEVGTEFAREVVGKASPPGGGKIWGCAAKASEYVVQAGVMKN
jgi:hypothetical protein